MTGPGCVVELINPTLAGIYSKTVEELLGQQLFDMPPHLKGLGFEELLDGVRQTGVPFKGDGYPAPFLRNGKLETFYFNFVYEPFHKIDGSITGVIVVAIEVTEQLNARKQVEEAEERAGLAVGLGIFDLDFLTGGNDYLQTICEHFWL